MKEGENGQLVNFNPQISARPSGAFDRSRVIFGFVVIHIGAALLFFAWKMLRRPTAHQDSASTL